MDKTCLIERGTVGRVEDAYRHYIGGGQSEEPSGLTVHWQPEGSRGEHEQHVPFAYLDDPLFRPAPGDGVFCLTNLSGGCVFAVVIKDVVCFNSTPYSDEELAALASSSGARHGGALALDR
jgi:hypothetical protein